MKARLQVSIGVIVVLLLFFSCARPAFSLMGIHTGVSLVHQYDSEGTLLYSYEALSVFIESEEDANLQMEVSSPDGLNTWLFPAVKKSVGGLTYYGKAALSLGQRVSLPRGEWSLRVLRDDGRTISENFTLEKGSDPPPFLHHLDAGKGELILDDQVRECAIQLLDEKKKSLYSTLTKEQTLNLASLYAKWDKVRFVVLSWYDEPSKQSQIAWYEL